MAARFGTSGLRGLVEELVDGTAARHVGAFTAYLIASGRCAAGGALHVGHDLRCSSPLLARQCMAAIEANGLSPIDCGPVPTPALALHAMQNGAGSVMITGSHIPDDRNGVKFYRPDGEIDKRDEIEISGRALSQGDPALVLHDETAVSLRQEVLAGYVSRYAGMLGTGGLRGLRIGVYEHSTVARDVLCEVLSAAGADIVRLGRSNRFIPVDTEAVSEDVQARIREWTLTHRLDALASADGDGDRPLLADEKGDCLRGDLLGLLTARWLDADAVATPITSNSGIEAHVGARVWRTRVGSPYVIEAIAEAEATGSRRIIGFEANGGVLTGSGFNIGAARLAALPTRDSLLPILGTLAAAQSAGLTLSGLAASLALPKAASGLIRALPTQTSLALIAGLMKDSERCAAFCQPFGALAQIDVTDGLRMQLADGALIHLRPSGNAPEMRVYVEAHDAVRTAQLMQGAIDRVGVWIARL